MSIFSPSSWSESDESRVRMKFLRPWSSLVSGASKFGSGLTWTDLGLTCFLSLDEPLSLVCETAKKFKFDFKNVLPRRGSSVSIASFKRSRIGATLLIVRIQAVASSGRENPILAKYSELSDRIEKCINSKSCSFSRNALETEMNQNASSQGLASLLSSPKNMCDVIATQPIYSVRRVT